MSVRTGHSVRRLILHEIVCFLAITWTLTMAILMGIGIHERIDWFIIATVGVSALVLPVGCIWIVCTSPRQRGLLRSCERAAGGRLIQRIALAQVHASVVPVSQLGWLVLAADSLTFTPDPELPSLLQWNVTLPEPGQEVDIPPIARAAILRISSERVGDPSRGTDRLLRVCWADPSGREATADFLIKGRHGGWIAASPDRPARPARTWLRRRAASLPPAIARLARRDREPGVTRTASISAAEGAGPSGQQRTYAGAPRARPRPRR